MFQSETPYLGKASAGEAGNVKAPPLSTPLNERLNAALTRLGHAVNRTETILNRLREPTPVLVDHRPDAEAQISYSSAHSAMLEMEYKLDTLEKNIDNAITLL